MKYLKMVVDDGFLNEGKYVDDFKERLIDKFGLINPVLVNSCTSALHMAVNLSNVGVGDEVILSPQTFISSGLSVLMEKAKPVFVDIQKYTGNINPDSIRKSITDKTKAIMVVHWGGYPCDMDEIQSISDEYNIPIIEDAAHSVGSSYKGNPIGSISDFTCFSFQSIKHLTTGDGGALCCKNDDDYEMANKMKWFGIDRNSSPSFLGEKDYDVDRIGFKYHMNNIDAAIGLGNMESIDNVIQKHKDIYKIYNDGLKDVGGIKLLEHKEDRETSSWIYTILVDKRNDFIKMMKSNNIPVSVIHQRIDRNSIFGLTPGLHNQEYFDEYQINLPIHSEMETNDVYDVIEKIKSGW